VARNLGYGGLANTGFTRDFSGKETAVVESVYVSTLSVALQIGISIALILLL
jgi:hypothetical protein